MIYTVLKFLSGKKSSIATILMGVVAYLSTKEILGEPEVILITLIVATLFGTASVVTKRVVYPAE